MTQHTRTSLLLITLVASIAAGGLKAAHRAPSDSLALEEQELVDFAFRQFAAADIELPDVEITFPVDPDRCFGYGGVYVPSDHAVRICRPSPTTMIHELAHAWIESTFTDADRDAFLELRGLDTWTGGESWDERGAEQAAEIITWAVMDRDISVRWIETDAHAEVAETTRLYKVPNSNSDQLVLAYRHLTGNEPVARLADAIRRPAPSEVMSPEGR